MVSCFCVIPCVDSYKFTKIMHISLSPRPSFFSPLIVAPMLTPVLGRFSLFPDQNSRIPVFLQISFSLSVHRIIFPCVVCVQIDSSSLVFGLFLYHLYKKPVFYAVFLHRFFTRHSPIDGCFSVYYQTPSYLFRIATVTPV